MVLRKKSFRELPQVTLVGTARGIVTNAEEPAKNSPTIGFQNRQAAIECLRENRANRVAAHARQGPSRGGVGGKAAAMHGDHCAGGAVQIARTAIVAQAFPEP